MAATVPAAFDPQPKYLYETIDCIAGAAVKGGDVVAINATGVDFTVQPCDGVTTSMPIGVALNSQATVGGHVSVAGPGTIVKVKEGAGSAIDAGDAIQTAVSTAVGCVITAARGAVGYQIGIMLEDTAGNGTGYALLTGPLYMNKGA